MKIRLAGKSQEEVKRRFRLFALAAGAPLPKELEISAFADYAKVMRWGPSWKARYGVTFPKTHAEWVGLLSRTGAGWSEIGLFADGKIKPRDVLAFLGGRTKADRPPYPADTPPPDPVITAVAMKVQNPGLSTRKIAEAVGMARSTLARRKVYKRAAAAAQAKHGTRGTKSKTGNVEAESEDD